MLGISAEFLPRGAALVLSIFVVTYVRLLMGELFLFVCLFRFVFVFVLSSSG